ncbi:MAG TPA: sugar ABC transporter permease [Caldithrix abyssi]|uniref:Sugar ABC transporter permease n=1 Tax=Caldithrix abyssi TaxID=187145 RepID=A0A7V5H4B3_CALAY|nr:sugar ABC transporter permease [Caldisericaceae bacterium]HHE55432.1 sugar ABC transporter permease [Caldithrix abyssi]
MKKNTAIFFLIPALLLLFLVALFPLGYGFVLGLMRKMPVFGISKFVGLENFLFLLKDLRFQQSLLTTLKFTVISVPLELLLGLGFALLLREKIPGNFLLKITLMIPWAIPTVVSARMWEWIYNPEYGLLNYLLKEVGLLNNALNWLGHPFWTLPAIILADVWKTTPFAALLIYAGLQAIPEELYEAAKIDGAGALRRLIHITLPLIFPIILIVGVFRTMDAFRIFDLIYVMTGGGPANISETMSVYAYKLLFQTLQFGYGSAVSIIMFLIIALLSGLYVFILNRKFQILR